MFKERYFKIFNFSINILYIKTKVRIRADLRNQIFLTNYKSTQY